LGEKLKINFTVEEKIPDVDKSLFCTNCWIKYLCSGYCFYAQIINKLDNSIKFGYSIQNKLWDNTYKILIEFYNNPNKYSIAIEYYKNSIKGI